MKGKNIVITGGLGFLGSNLAHALIKKGARVTIIDNLNPLYGGNFFNIHGIEDQVALIINDIRNKEVILPIVKGADIIFHLAAQVSYIDSLNIPFEDLDLNARSTLLLLELLRMFNPKCKIIFSSSRMVLGKVEASKMVETCPTNPLSLYGIHKLTSEKYLQMYFKDFGIPFVILRITNPYGLRQQIKHNKYSLVGWFIRQSMENEIIKIFGKGNQLRDYIFSDDLIEGLIRCTKEEKAVGEIINLGSGISTEFQEMANTVVRIVGKGGIEYIPWPNDYEKLETGDITTDITKLTQLTNWAPTTNLEDGIRLTFNYFTKYLKYYL